MSQAAFLDPAVAFAPTSDLGDVRPLSVARVGDKGMIVRVDALKGALEAAELERRLLELGFVEGAAVEVLEEGLFGRDPIAVRLDDMRVALRRREAASIQVRFESGTAA